MPKRVDVGKEIIEFPDDMPDSEIDGVLRKLYPPEKPRPTLGSRFYDNAIAPTVQLARDILKKGGPQAVSDVVTGIKDKFVEGVTNSKGGGILGPIGDGIYNATYGPQVDTAVEDVAAGRYGAAAGGVAGMVAPLAVPSLPNAVRAVGNTTKRVLNKPMTAASQKLMKSSLEPFNVSDAPELADKRAIAQTALDHGVAASESGLSKLRDHMATQEQIVQGIVDEYAAKGHTISPDVVVARVRDAMKQVTPKSDIRDIGRVKDEFLDTQGARPARAAKVSPLVGPNGQPIVTPGTPAIPARPIPFDEAQAIKQGTYRKINDEYGKLSSADIEAQKDLAHGIKVDMEAIAPQLAIENAEWGKLIDLEGPLARAVRRADGETAAGLPQAGITRRAVDATINNARLKSELALAIYNSAKASGRPMSHPSALLRAGSAIVQIQKQQKQKDTQ